MRHLKFYIIGLLILWTLFSMLTSTLAQDGQHYASSEHGIVAAGRKGSAEAGASILRKGGNAADAAAATILALSVTDYGPFCIGGEAPLMIYKAATRNVKVMSGMGTAPKAKEAIQWYYDNGIPPNDLKAAAVPAVLDLCITLLDKYGTKSFGEICEPLLIMLKTGNEPWYERLEKTINRLIETEEMTVGNRSDKLKAIADNVYRGQIAEELDRWYKDRDGLLSKTDLATYRTRIENPVKIKYRDFEVFKCNTWTQGPVLCQTLRLLESYDLRGLGHNSPEYIHTVTEALKLAMADRDAFYGDPYFEAVPLNELLSDKYTSLRRSLIDPEAASHTPRPGDPHNMKPLGQKSVYEPWLKGTTTCVVADRYGNMVVATPSGWGNDGDQGGTTGITHGTRLLSFNTTPGHPNRIEAGKRPRITLTPTIILKEGVPIMGISVEGGDVQDQTTLQILLNIIEFGMGPYEALNAPRFATTLHEDSFDPNPERKESIRRDPVLMINETVDATTKTALEEKGHVLENTTGAIGVPAIVFIDENGQQHAATDSKTDHEVSSAQE